MRDKVHRVDITALKQRLSGLNEERTDYMFRLVHGKQMIQGLPHEVYRRCGKKTCKCTRGFKHGPYPALSVHNNGKQKTVMVKKADTHTILKRSKRYRYFQRTLSKIRRINKEIDGILEEIKKLTTESYP